VTSKTRFGCRTCLNGHRLFPMKRRLTIFLRLSNASCTRSTWRPLLPLSPRLRYVFAVPTSAVSCALFSTFKHPNIPLPALRAGALRTRWDFSRVRPTLIPSIAGKHEGWPAVLKSGHTALMRAVSQLNPQKRIVSLECQVRPLCDMGSGSTQTYTWIPTGVVNWGVQCRVAHRVRPLCARGQPRGLAQRAQISPRGDANAVA
jgi:hypothetical protein